MDTNMDRRSFMLSGTAALISSRLVPFYQVTGREPIYVYTIPNCVPCAKLKATINDPKVQDELMMYEIKFIEGPVKGITKYPFTQFKKMGFYGSKTPQEFLDWVDSVEKHSKDHD